MIPKSAIEDFLKRPLDDHRWLKKLSRKEIDRALSELRPPFRTDNKLRLHQKVCILLGIAYPRFAFWLDMGTGKTLISLELLRYWWESGQLRRALVFVTSDKAVPTWLTQMKRFGIKIPHCVLEGSSEEKWDRLFRFRNGIVFVTYPGAVAMVSDRVKKKAKKGKKSKGGKMVLNVKKLDALAKRLDVLFLDESTRAGHHQSLTHQLCNQLSKRAQMCYPLAGRPLGRDPTLLWAQHFITDRGETLGETLGIFRAAFFTESDNQWSEWAKDYTFKKKMMPQLSRMVQHRSIAYTADECIELPPVIPIIEEVSMPDESQGYYQNVLDQAKAAKGNYRAMKNAFLRMRQISSGFMGFVDDESDDRIQIEFMDNPKLDRTLELLEDIPEDRKALVFYEFTWSGRKLTDELKERGMKPLWLWSGTKNPGKGLDRFMEDPSCRVAIVNHKVGAYSLDGLQIANYLFFYESPLSVIDRDQAERRVRRQGQLHKVFQYDMVVKGSVDARILDYHREGKDLFKELLRDPERALDIKAKSRK